MLRASLDPNVAMSTSRLRVRFCETDLMGIVHHATYLVYFEAGRVEWLRARGLSYASTAASGVHLPVVDAQVRYLRPARFDDDLALQTTLAELRPASLRFDYVLARGEERLATGSTRLACVDETHRPRPIPDELRAALLAGEVVA